MEEQNKTVWVMVECVYTYRVRYLVETPADHPEYALDTVSMEAAKEFSQEYLGQLISNDCSLFTENEALAQCRAVNEYCAAWTDEQVKAAFFTSLEDQESANV